MNTLSPDYCRKNFSSLINAVLEGVLTTLRSREIYEIPDLPFAIAIGFPPTAAKRRKSDGKVLAVSDIKTRQPIPGKRMADGF